MDGTLRESMLGEEGGQEEMASEERLPREVIRRVAKALSKDQQLETLASLAATSGSMYDELLPLLYRHITLTERTATFFHALSDEVANAHPLTGWDLHRLRWFRPSWRTPSVFNVRTSFSSRAGMIRTIAVDCHPGETTPKRDGVQRKRRNCAEIWMDLPFTKIPALFPQLSSLVYTDDFLLGLQESYVGPRTGFSAPYLSAGDAWRGDMSDLGDALAALVKPSRICCHYPKQRGGEQEFGWGRASQLTDQYFAYSGDTSVMYHKHPNLKSVDWRTLRWITSIHIQQTGGADDGKLLDNILHLLGSRLNLKWEKGVRLIVHNCLPSTETARFADLSPMKNDQNKEIARPSLPSGVDLDRVDLLELPSSVAEQLWVRARSQAAASGVDGWTCPGVDEPRQWHELYDSLKYRLVCLPQTTSELADACAFCGGGLEGRYWMRSAGDGRGSRAARGTGRSGRFESWGRRTSCAQGVQWGMQM